MSDLVLRLARPGEDARIAACHVEFQFQPAKENAVDSNEPTAFILVEDGGLEPSTSAM